MNEDNQNQNNYDLVLAKTIKFYGAMVNAWFATKMELDKSLLTLSTAGIGLLITLATTTHINTWLHRLFLVIAIICFLATIVSILLIFHFNAPHLENIVLERDDDSKRLTKLDRVASLAFFFGLLFSVIFGISVIYN